jgi:hypothetical protein
LDANAATVLHFCHKLPSPCPFLPLFAKPLNLGGSLMPGPSRLTGVFSAHKVEVDALQDGGGILPSQVISREFALQLLGCHLRLVRVSKSRMRGGNRAALSIDMRSRQLVVVEAWSAEKKRRLLGL